MIKTEYICDVCGNVSEDKNFLKKLHLEMQINGNVKILINKDVCTDCDSGVTEGNTKEIKKCLEGFLQDKYSLKGAEPVEPAKPAKGKAK